MAGDLMRKLGAELAESLARYLSDDEYRHSVDVALGDLADALGGIRIREATGDCANRYHGACGASYPECIPKKV